MPLLGENLSQHAKNCRIVVSDHNVAYRMGHINPLVDAGLVLGTIFLQVVQSSSFSGPAIWEIHRPRRCLDPPQVRSNLPPRGSLRRLQKDLARLLPGRPILFPRQRCAVHIRGKNELLANLAQDRAEPLVNVVRACFTPTDVNTRVNRTTRFHHPLSRSLSPTFLDREVMGFPSGGKRDRCLDVAPAVPSALFEC